MREIVDRLVGLLGFSVRVTERAGTPLSSLLCNKNMWKGQDCKREECHICCQPGEKREDCKRRNVLYESGCMDCIEPDVWERSGLDALAESGDHPSIYVGESARSICERSSEHWRDALAGKEESHMVEHRALAHSGSGKFNFRFKVVKAFKSSLDRQIAEAVRIQRRGSILNRKGEFNRCGLTRLGLDRKWEGEKWDKAWEEREEPEMLCIDSLEDSRKTRGEGQPSDRPAKRRRVPSIEGGEVWGESLGAESRLVQNFLLPELRCLEGHKKTTQTKLNCLTGSNWLMFELVRELVRSAADLAADLELAAGWEDWQHTEEERITVEKRWSGVGKPSVSPHPPHKKQNNKNNKNKNENTKVKTETKSNKRGKEKNKNMLIKGQGTLDRFVVKVCKPVKDDLVLTELGDSDNLEDDLWKCEDVLSKEYRLYKVSMLRKYFVPVVQAVCVDSDLDGMMCEQAGGVHDAGIVEIQEYVGLGEGQRTGCGWPGDQQENTSNNDDVMRRRGASRLSMEEYPVATINIFESGGGNTHTSEGQLCDEQYNRKYKEENIFTPKRKLSLLQDSDSQSPSLGTAQLSDQWKPACDSPAKRIKLILFD